MTTEYAIFQHPEVQIYPSKAVFRGKTYFTPNITAVSIKEKAVAEQASVPGYLVGCGTAILVIAIGTGISYIAPDRWYDLISYITAGIALLVGAAGFSAGQTMSGSVKPAHTLYTVVLETNSGRVEAYSTAESNTAADIRSAIERAASRRR
ncbi:DUF6232 family protein [Deinococcus sp. UR1]|uniref:DUF6232 family protein n=1 Tax=Deinococcus sp. UR1 TaxID=1704277 RepID=UPI0011AF3B04|nr:DUF6232 family protein [Deinococcus sp. UR1]